MGIIDRYRKAEAAELASMVASALAERLSQNGAAAPIIVIGKLDVRVNYASGGGATVKVVER